MNHITQLNRILVLQKKYQDYIPFCKTNDKEKLEIEIKKLNARVDNIYSMDIQKSYQELASFNETKQSRMNFKTKL